MQGRTYAGQALCHSQPQAAGCRQERAAQEGACEAAEAAAGEARGAARAAERHAAEATTELKAESPAFCYPIITSNHQMKALAVRRHPKFSTPEPCGRPWPWHHHAQPCMKP